MIKENPCPYCYRRFEKPHGLTVHKAKVHPEFFKMEKTHTKSKKKTLLKLLSGFTLTI